MIINDKEYPVVSRSSVYNPETDEENIQDDVIYYWEKGDSSHPWIKVSATIDGYYYEGIGNVGTSRVFSTEESLSIALNDLKEWVMMDIE
jgi:hypothetical protein